MRGTYHSLQMIVANPHDVADYHVLKLETHLHTVHSDGQHTVREMFEACCEAGYDAVALTDHNSQSGIAEAGEVAAELGLVLVPGVEVTTFHGHAVVLGVSKVPEWRTLESTGMDALLERVHAAAGIVCVAHPAALGSPVCSGCAWEWPVAPSGVDLWEVFSASRPNAEVPLELWRRLVASGGTVAPVAAGDVHSVAAARRPRIATFVYARERSTSGVLEALQARRVFTSDAARLDPWLANDVARQYFDTPTGRVAYAERRDAQGVLVGLSAPIWIDTSQ